MATRASSRRSAGGADQLNPATIQLLGLGRLREELTKRGISTEGSKDMLADRLEDFIKGDYVPPPVTIESTTSTPSASRNQSAKNTPKSRTNSAKAAPAKRTPRRRTSVASATEGESPKIVESPPIKKPRRNSTKNEEPPRDSSIPPKKRELKEEEIVEEGFSVTVIKSTGPVFDSEDDEPLINLTKGGAGVDKTDLPAAEADSVINEEKGVRKKKRRRKDDEDIESGAVLAKGDSEWVPPEESERRVTRDSDKKRTRKNTTETKEESEEHEELPSVSMPLLDPEIYDQDGGDERERTQIHTSSDRQRKPSIGEGGKKVKIESGSIDRPRSISITGGKEKEKRRDSIGAPRPPKEKPATQLYAELMAQKKAAAAAASNGAVGTPTTTIPSVVVKSESQEKEMSGGASPLEKGKMDSSVRRDSIGMAGSPATDSVAAPTVVATPKGFQMAPRKNAPPRQSTGLPDLLGDLLGKQQVLLEKKVKSTAEAEAEKIRIVSQMKQRAPDLKDREETVKEEKERALREEEERRKAREERERKEKEKRSLIIPAPTRSVPPPPSLPPAIKHEVSPQEQPDAADSATATVAVQKGSITPKIEPLEEESVQVKKEPATVIEVKTPEYEPLAPGPSMPLLDRSIADAHHKARAERREKERTRRKDSKDHGLVAPELPGIDDPFLKSLEEKLKKIVRQREKSPIPSEIRECMEELLKKVEKKVEKEMKWERRTKRKSEYQVEREKEEQKKRAQMMADPRALLAKAANIFESMHNNGSVDEDPADSPSSVAIQISQDLAEPGTYDEDKEDKPLPEFHGEPVPSDDDEALFLEAAGLPKRDKRPKHPVVEEEAPPSHEHILMDYYNACLHIKSATDKPWLIEPDNENGLALMWGGVRTNHGYVLPWREERKKALIFQIKITEHQSIRHIPFMEQEPHDVRIGFSLRASPNVMGEAPLSWAFSTTGKKCVNNAFQEWGEPCEIGDIVTAVLDFSASSISFYKNEECMGVAFSGIGLPDGDAVYAHVCVKNCKVAVNLGEFPPVEGGWRWAEGEKKPDLVFGPLPNGAPPSSSTSTPSPPLIRDPSWVFPTELDRKRYEMSRLPPNEKASCTLLMMVGLPGVGKSTWVRQYIRDHPEEKWDVINAEAVMAAMKVNGVARGRAHIGRWDMVLGLVAKALQKMVLLAARRRRNYIVDLSNVSKDSRKRRLMHFKDFTKKCIVLVPDEEEMVNRQMKQTRQEGASHVPAEAILEMKAVFTFPSEEPEGIDEVHLIEPPMTRIADAIEIIQRFNVEGKPWYQNRYRGRGSRRGGRGGYMGGDRRGSDYARPLSVSTAASNGSGPPTGGGGGAGGPSPRAWGGMAESPSTTGHFSWTSRKASN